MPVYTFQNAAAQIALRILVFGPDPRNATLHPRSRLGKLATKRIEIRDCLVSDGHEAVFPEDLYNKVPPAPNIAAQEFMMMRQFDFIVIIVDSPGSNVELGVVSTRAELAGKTHAFIDATYSGGFAYKSCELLKQINGEFTPYNYPHDVVSCSLKTWVEQTVRKLQLIRYLS